MIYLIRYEVNGGDLTWWSRAFDENALLHQIKICLSHYPMAKVIIEKETE
jgi:hypothetical protein